jgi:O-antigen/teichoic acid export membrane protein
VLLRRADDERPTHLAGTVTNELRGIDEPQSFVRNVGETFANRVAIAVLGLVTGVVVARELGPTGRGTYALAISTAALFAQFGNLGLHASNTYFVARARDRLATLAANSLALSAAVGLAGAGILVLLHLFASTILPLSAPMVGIVAVGIPLLLAYVLIQNLALGAGAVRSYNLIDLLQRILVAAAALALLALGLLTPRSIVSATVVAFALCLMLLMRSLRIVPRAALRPSLPLFRQTIGYGLRAYGSALGSYMVIRSDLFLVSHYNGLQATGIYSTAVGMVDLLQLFPIAVGTILFARLAQHADDDYKWSVARRAVLTTGAVMVGFAAISAVLAPYAIRVVYGSEYLPAVTPFRLMLPGIVAISVNMIIMNYMASIGMPAIAVYSPWLATALNVTLNVLLLDRIGIKAAAIDTTIAYVLMLAVSLLWLRRRRS